MSYAFVCYKKNYFSNSVELQLFEYQNPWRSCSFCGAFSLQTQNPVAFFFHIRSPVVFL